MEFLSAAMLWGGLAAAVPLALHLIGRRAPVRHRFSALQFLQASQKSRSRALRIKHILLLLLRMLVIGLLALTLARPLWPVTPSVATTQGALRGDFVVILDSSLSMRTEWEGQSRFQAAQERALEFLSMLAHDARVALIFGRDKPEPAMARLSLNHQHASRLISAKKPTFERMDLHGSLAAATRILEQSAATGQPRAIVLFTDLQASMLEGAPARTSGDANDPPPLIVCTPDGGTPLNGAVLKVSLPAVTAAQQPLQLQALVRPVDPNRACVVDLYVDGVKAAQEAVHPNGADQVELTFTFPAGDAGEHGGEVRLEQSDALLADQRWYFHYQAGVAPKALLLESQHEGRRSGQALAAALGTKGGAQLSGLELHRELSTHWDGVLDGYELVILANPGPLPPSHWTQLKAFVENGGGLYAFPGARTPLAEWATQGFSETAPHHGLFPGKLEAWEALEQPQRARLRGAYHPLAASLNPQLRSDLGDVHIKRRLRLDWPAGAPGEVVLACEDGAPLLAEKSYGRGRVALMAVSAEREDSSLPSHGAIFLSLAVDAARLLTRRDSAIEAKLGRDLEWRLEPPPREQAETEVRWLKPGASLAERLSATKLETPSGGPEAYAVRLLDLDQPGIHELAWRSGGQEQRRVLALNFDPSESVLEAGSLDDVRKLYPGEVTLVADPANAPMVAASTPRGQEFPALLLCLVLAILLAECFWANRLYRSATEPEPSAT
jgi:hypothetical protein